MQLDLTRAQDEIRRLLAESSHDSSDCADTVKSWHSGGTTPHARDGRATLFHNTDEVVVLVLFLYSYLIGESEDEVSSSQW